MRSLYLALAAASLAATAFFSPAHAEDVTLCAGAKGRNYDSVMLAVGFELIKRSHTVEILNLGGSEDILNALKDGRCSYGPAQKDIFYSMSKQNMSLTNTVSASKLLYNEAMTMFCSSDSGIDELSDIDETTTIIIDEIGTGSALTWSTMVKIETEYGRKDDWINAQTKYYPLRKAQAAIALGEADCAFGVGAVPTSWGTELNEGGATVVWVYDKDLNDLMLGKSPLYTPVRVARGAYNTKFDTYAIPAVLFQSQQVPLSTEVSTIIERAAASAGAQYNTVK